MRRLFSIIAIVSLFFVIVTLGTLTGSTHRADVGTPVATSVAAGPPSYYQDPDFDITVEILGTVQYHEFPFTVGATEVVTASPASGTPPAIWTVTLKRVTMGPGVDPGSPHPHDGAFVLTVASGAICYENTVPNEGEISEPAAVVAYQAPVDGEIPSECSESRTQCAAPAGCVLVPNERVYLPAGSSLVQTGSAHHWYANYGTVDAVVYLAEDQGPPTGLPGCGTGCY
jgi:hypothetical protein